MSDLRSILARFSIIVDTSALVAADILINKTISDLEKLDALFSRLKGFRVPVPKQTAPGQSPVQTSAPAAPAQPPAPPKPSAQSVLGAGQAASLLTDLKVQERAALVSQRIGQLSADAAPKVAKLQAAQAKAAGTSVDLDAKQRAGDQSLQSLARAFTAGGSTSDVMRAKLERLQAAQVRLKVTADAAKDRVEGLRKTLDGLQTEANQVAGAVVNAGQKLTWFQKIREKLGSSGTRAATGQLIPGNTKQELEAAADAGQGLFAVLGRVRRIWGLVQFSLAGGFAIAGIGGLINEMDEASKQANRLGMEIEDYQVLEKFAKLAGAETAELSNVVKQLAKNVNLAANGGKLQAKAFAELGVNLKDTNGEYKDAIDLLFEVGGKIGPMTNNTKKLALAQQLLGKASLSILPAFKDGTVAAQEQLKALRDLAVAYNQADADAAEAFNDTLDVTIHQLRSVALQGVAIVLPYLVNLVTWLMRTTKELKDVIKTSSTLQTVFVAFGALLASHVIGKFVSALFHVKQFGSYLLKFGQVFLRFIAPFLILESVITWLRGGDSLFGRLLNRLQIAGKGSKEWREEVKKGFDYFLKTLELLGSAWRVFRAWFTGDKTILRPGDLANDAELRERLNVIVTTIKDTLVQAWDKIYPAVAGKLKKFWDNLFKEGGGGAPDESLLADLGGVLAKWLVLGWTIKLSAGLLLNVLYAALYRLFILAGFAGAMGSSLAWSWIAGWAAPLLTGLGTAIAGAFAGVTAVGIAAVAGLALVLAGVLWLIFDEEARAALGRFFVKLGAWAVEAGKAIATWGAAFRQACLDLVGVMIEAFGSFWTWLRSSVTSFSWDGFLDGFLKALAVMGEKLKLLFTNPLQFLKEMSELMSGQQSLTLTPQQRLRTANRSNPEDVGRPYGPGNTRNMTVNDNRQVSQSFTGAAGDPSKQRQATSGAVSWIDRPSAFEDADEVSF